MKVYKARLYIGGTMGDQIRLGNDYPHTLLILVISDDIFPSVQNERNIDYWLHTIII